MIAWLLQQVEQDPSAVFLESNLLEYDATGFDRAIADGLLRKVPSGAMSSVVRGSDVWTVLNDGDDVEMFDPEDVEAPIVEAHPAEATGWVVDFECLSAGLALSLALRPAHEALTSRLFIVGEHDPTAAVLLGLFPSTYRALHDLAAIRERLPARYSSLIVILPTLLVPARLERSLAEARILPVHLNDDLSVTPTIPEALRHIAPATVVGRQDPASGFRYSADFKSCRLPDGRAFSLTSSQSLIVEMLFDAYSNGTPDLSDEYVLSRLGDADEGARRRRTLRDVFKNSKAWNTLVVEGETRGSHRLNLP